MTAGRQQGRGSVRHVEAVHDEVQEGTDRHKVLCTAKRCSAHGPTSITTFGFHEQIADSWGINWAYTLVL